MRRNRILRPRAEALESRALLSTMVVESEPNDLRRQANVVGLDPSDGQAVIEGTVAAGGDVDQFAVRLPAGGRYRLVVGRTDAATADVRIDGTAGGRRLGQARLGEGDSTGFVARGGQTVALRLRGPGDAATSYTLQVRAVPIAGSGSVGVLRGGMIQEVEPNDTAVLANRILLPEFTPVLIRGVGGAFDLDTFEFVPRRGGVLQITNLAVSGPAQYLLETTEFFGVINEFATIPSGGSVQVPVFRGVRYRLRWLLDTPTQTPYLLRLQVFPPLAIGTPTTPGTVPPFGGGSTTGGI